MINKVTYLLTQFQQIKNIYKVQLIYFFRLIITLLLVTFIIRKVDTNAFVQTIRSANIGLLIIAIFLYYPGQIIASFRWYYLLRKIKQHIPFLSIVRYQLLGQLSTFFLPGQVSGDLVRFFSVSSKKSNKITFAYSIIMDKLIFLFALACFTMLGLFAVGQISKFLPVYLISIIIFFSSLAIIIILGIYRNEKLVNKVNSITDKTIIHKFLKKIFVDSFEIPRIKYQSIILAVFLALVLQFMNVVGSYLVLLSLGITIEFIDWAAINAIVAIVLALPITIAGLGVREGILVYILTFYGISASQTVAYSMLALTIVIMLLVIGIFVLERLSRWTNEFDDNI
jgi:glycosyltransferase 2 family protein